MTEHNTQNKKTPLAMHNSRQQLLIEGASCASCVNKIEAALNAVPGVDHAEMNLAQRTVSVSGSALAEPLIHAIENIGYKAQTLDDKSDSEVMDQKEQADQTYYKRLIRDMSVALGLGIPLMIYGLFIGEMTVSTSNQRIAWGLVGLATLWVMATSGRHFYVGGWKSIGSHTANMDT